ncbi:centrosome-associated protein 350-like [Diadema antillarum]|uniref:centrosome-associated protein 350-like n=1 Tax=Diadema antillarum TaxID=105358 RepID=UPI003A8B277F
MASTTVRARRVTEPTPVQKQPYQLNDEKPFANLESAWDNITEAKTALYRAEARLEQSENGPHLRDHRSSGSHLEKRHPAGARAPVDSVPSMEIKTSATAKFDPKSRGYQSERTRKRVTIADDTVRTRELAAPSDITPSPILSQRHGSQLTDNFQNGAPRSDDSAGKLVNSYGGLSRTDFREPHGESSSRDILGNGPANFSIGSSTDIRILNDIATPSLVRQSSTVEMEPGLRVSKDYIPAYDRLFGDKPVLKLSQKDPASSLTADNSENKWLSRLVSCSQTPQDQSYRVHMDRLRKRVEQQRMASSQLLESSADTQRKRHQESDPVRFNSEAEADVLLGHVAPPKVPVRKVASAPAAPAYRGFSQAEARFQLVPGGRIVTEDQIKRKTSRQNIHHREDPPALGQRRTDTARPLQPSQKLAQDNRVNSKTNTSRGNPKPVRKVHKAPLPTSKPKRPEPVGGIGVSAWREGQRTVIKVLGPPPKVPRQQFAVDATSDQGQDSNAPSDAAGNKTGDEIDRLSEHPIDSDNDMTDNPHSNSNPPSIGRLPEEAQGILNDLHLDPTDEDRDSSPIPVESKSSKNNNNVPRLSKKKKASRLKAREDEHRVAPVRKVRHYEVEEVQKYMARQRMDRRKKIQEDKKQKALQAEKKKEQLQDLYKRQRDSAKPPTKIIAGGSFAAGDGERRFLDETFSKGPGQESQGGLARPLARPVTLSRQHAFQENYNRRIDVTGSDKENRAFWSTSSSDSSLRSSPQTDVSASTPQDPNPAAAGVSIFHDPHHQHSEGAGLGRDIVLEPVREEDAPTASMVIKNQLDDNEGRPSKNDVAAGVASHGAGPPNQPSTVTRPRPVTSPGKPRSKAERVAAIRASAAALQGRLENEVRQLTGDLSHLTATALGGSQHSPGAASLRSPSNERWAYPYLGLGRPVPTTAPSQVARPSAHVRFSMPEPALWERESPKLTKHQRVAGSGKDPNVFVGSLPGVSNLSQQARQTEEGQTKGEAATTIQAAFRGHQVRQRLNWELPSGTTLKQRIKGQKTEAQVPQIRLSAVGKPAVPSGHPMPERALQSDGESLSEGPLSDESSEAEVDQEYTPKFKSLPTRAQKKLHHPHDNKQTNLNFGREQSSFQPHHDGLSVIDIYMKRYQEGQRDIRVARSPIPASASADNIREIASTASPASHSKTNSASRPPTGRSLSFPSAGTSTSSPSDTLNSLSVSEKKRSRTPSPRPLSLRDAGTQTPPSSRSSPSSIKSRSSSSRGSHSPPSDARSPVSDHHKSPVDEIRSLIEDLKKSTSSNSESVHGEGTKSDAASGNRSPLTKTPSESPTSPHPSLGLSPPVGRSAKSPVTREVLNHFKPISHPGSELSARSRAADQSSSTSSILSSAMSQPGPKFFSPSTLQLKMAAELNLLETLEESVRQLSEVERSRAVALAQQESSSLAKILQARQRDHEKELQLLSLKARQEVEAANRQLEEVRERAAVTALEAEQVLVQAKRDAAAETRDSAQKLLQTQADAARVTAEAAKQLAEAHKVSVSAPPPPQVDVGQVAADTAKAAASAAVGAALEQQRLHQRDLLKEMQASLHPPPPVTRSIATGDSRVSSATPSRSVESKTPSASYTEDFTNTASASSRTPSSTSQSAADTISSQRIPTASDSSYSKHSDASNKSAKTMSSVPFELDDESGKQNQSDSIATVSDLAADEDVSRGNASSSIRTESDARGASSASKSSIPDEVNETKSNLDQYSGSFDDSGSDEASIPSVISPSPPKTEAKKDARSTPRRFAVRDAGGARDVNESTDSVQTEKEVSFSVTTIEVIQKQLKEEEARSQQQVTLLRLREKVLVDKTNAELEWLEHQKKRHKEKDDQEGVANLRKRQKVLLAKLQAEQAEIRRLLTVQKQSSIERQRLLYQQQEIMRIRKAATRYKDQLKDLPPATPNASSIQASSEDESVDGGMLGLSDSNVDPSSLLPGGSSPVGPQRASPQDQAAVEKQAKVMQKLKMLQQPLSMKLLMKREMKLKKRRKNAEELLAWKQRLDEEEKHVASMEHEVLHLWDATKQRKSKLADRHSKERAKPEASVRDGDSYSDDDISEDFSFKSSVKSEVSLPKSKSESHRSGPKSASSERKVASNSDASIAEDLPNSSINEDISAEKPQSSKSATESPHQGGDLSSDDTIKEASALQDYGSDSFESADHTLTPSKAESSLRGAKVLSSSPPLPATALSSSTPKSLGSSGSIPSRKSPFNPAQRSRHPSDSGSESEKSFSQTMSETASDQSDIEGRVRALKDALKKRKMEADRLRKQQKRLNREKLKAQEASLKKQLETYDVFIEKTKSELDQESRKQKLQGSLLPTPTAKPQIKQPKAGTDSLRHARALRQRTASDSSQDGHSEGRSVASVRVLSGSESGRSSRSSLEGVVGEERPANLPGSKDFSNTSSPSTQHYEGALSPKSPHSISRDRSISASSSIGEDISIRSDFSDRESVHDSEKFDSEDHRKIKERLQREEPKEEEDEEEKPGAKDAFDVSISPIPDGRLSGDGKEAEETGPANISQVALSSSPALSEKHTPAPDTGDDDTFDRDISISSSVPEEVISAASARTQESLEESAKMPMILPTSPKSDREEAISDHLAESPSLPKSPQVAPLSPTAKAPVSQTPEDASLRSAKSATSSVYSQSSSHLSPRSQSARSDASYSDSFLSGSKDRESRSDTEEDISEHLSEVSIAQSSHSAHSGQLVFDLKDKPRTLDTPEQPAAEEDHPEATIVPKRQEDEDDVKDATFDVLPAVDEPTDVLTTDVPEPTPTVLAHIHLGDEVLISGKQPGTLRFKGPTEFASGMWAGVELRDAVGRNDGSIEGVSYFICQPNYGIFAPVDRVAPLPKDFKPAEVTPVSDDEEEASELIEEDIPSQSSVKTVSESDPIKSGSVHTGVALEEKAEELGKDEDKESEPSLSQLVSLRSEDNLEEATDDNTSVGSIDDDALEKLISNAAEAVESFSHDEHLKIASALDTPRGGPDDIEELPHEDQEEQQEEAETKLVNSITDHLVEVVVRDTFDAMLDVAEQQQSDEQEAERQKSQSKESLFSMLVSAESPRSDSEHAEVPVEKSVVEVSEKQTANEKADSIAKSLMNEAIGDLLRLRRERNEKIKLANQTLKQVEQKSRSKLPESRSPEEVTSPEIRAETPYTPDKSPERRIENIAPLDDDIFINRVRVESSLGNDTIPVARPGSPVFGESGSVSPEALNEKLEQLQALDKDLLEADLFGDQEWFDDEFGSMPKSQSIIKVPKRMSVDEKQESAAAIAAQEAKVAAKRNAKLDLKKIVEEPFYAVPHNVRDVKDIACKSVKVFHERVLTEEPVASLAPSEEILGSETKGTDIESTSRRAYKHLMFTLSGEVYRAICQEQEPTVQPPWMKPKRKPRRFFFQQPPRNEAEMTTAVGDRVLSLTGLVSKPRQETALSGSKLSKKKDHVDEILIDELKAEEPEWIDYDEDELSVKMQLADALFESLLVDTAMVLHQIEDKRKARSSGLQGDQFRHHDVEF